MALALIFISAALAVTVTMSVSMSIYNGIIKDVSARSNTYSAMSEIDDIVRENYYGKINGNLLSTMISDGYVEGLGDRYSYYMTADEYSVYKEEAKGNKGGIGVIAVYDSVNNSIYVSEISEGSPAQLQGIAKGDVITAVDSQSVTPRNADDLIESLNGAKLTNVSVTFTHAGESKTVSVARGYNAQTVYYSASGNVGTVKITNFYGTTPEQLRGALKYMSENAVTSIIFDVRNNAGGLVRYAAECIDILAPVAAEGTGAIATAIDNDGKTVETFTSDSDSVSYAMAVLVNSGTSGAAELFACDLKDFGMAQLVGDKTVGNGTMQKVFELNDGSAIVLTVAKIIPYKSESYNETGLLPDYPVELTAEQNQRLLMLSPEEDAQYQKALQLMNK